MSAQVKHNYSLYTRGCRCKKCRAAATEYSRNRRDSRLAWMAEHGLPRSIPHGVSAYVNWGCRCDDCRAAWAKYQRDAYWRKRGVA